MVDNNLIKIVDNELRKNVKDKTLKENLEKMGYILEQNFRILSSFEKYVKEIETDALTWGPCHTEKFWKETVKRFEEDEFKYIKKLVSFLDYKDNTTRAVACYDLGEFCRFHPFARR